VIPTGGFGEPFRWPGELVGPDGEGLAFGVALCLVGVGIVGAGLGVGTAGTGEIAERVAGCGADEDAAGVWAAADVAELAGPDPAAAELPAVELPAVELPAVELPGA
jgi:hypothetical protein